MKNLLDSLMKFLRGHALSLPAVVLIIALGVSYLLFYTSSIEPTLSMRGILATQITDEQKALADLKAKPQDSPQILQARLATAQSSLASTVGSFLTDAEANQVIASLYQDAGASGVTITELQAQNAIQSTPVPTSTVKPPPTPAPPPSPTGTIQTTSTPPPSPTLKPTPTPTTAIPGPPIVSVTNVRVQAQGTSRQLVDFASRLKGQLSKGAVVNNVSLIRG